MKLRTWIIVCLSFSLLSCGKDAGKTRLNFKGTNQPTLNQITAGNYQSPCFLNKLATQGFASNVYGKSLIHLNANGTGSTDFELFSDDTCTTLLHSGTVTILEHESLSVAGQNVLYMKQDDGSNIMELWIAYSLVLDQFYFDIDYSDANSGPYTTIPTALEIDDFLENPAIQGVPIVMIAN